MNTKNENFTPRDRVDAPLMEQLLREDAARTAPAATNPQYTRTAACVCRQTAARRTRTENGSGGMCPACGRPLAMVYSPVQEFDDLYEAEEGLCRGTIFKELDMPLCVGWCNEGRCRR